MEDYSSTTLYIYLTTIPTPPDFTVDHPNRQLLLKHRRRYVAGAYAVHSYLVCYASQSQRFSEIKQHIQSSKLGYSFLIIFMIISTLLNGVIK
jgi:hypothetical protein